LASSAGDSPEIFQARSVLLGELGWRFSGDSPLIGRRVRRRSSSRPTAVRVIQSRRDESGAETICACEVAVSGTWTCTEWFRAPVVAPDATGTAHAAHIPWADADQAVRRTDLSAGESPEILR